MIRHWQTYALLCVEVFCWFVLMIINVTVDNISVICCIKCWWLKKVRPTVVRPGHRQVGVFHKPDQVKTRDYPFLRSSWETRSLLSCSITTTIQLLSILSPNWTKEYVILEEMIQTELWNFNSPPRWRRGSGLDFGSEYPGSIPRLPSPRVGPLTARR